MSALHLTTLIHAPAGRVFDLARNISLHKISMSASQEKAVAGVMSGPINLNETVTWEAKHFFKLRRFTSQITFMQIPERFTDEMIKGDFKQFKHEHHFKVIENGTIMIDLIDYTMPYGRIGRMVDRFHMRAYLHRMMEHRNNVIKEYAETEKWKSVLL